MEANANHHATLREGARKLATRLARLLMGLLLLTIGAFGAFALAPGGVAAAQQQAAAPDIALQVDPQPAADAIEPEERATEGAFSGTAARLLIGLVIAAVVGGTIWLVASLARRRGRPGRRRSDID